MNESWVYSTLPHCVGGMTNSYPNTTSRNGLGLFLARTHILVTWFLTKKRNLKFFMLLIFSWGNFTPPVSLQTQLAISRDILFIMTEERVWAIDCQQKLELLPNFLQMHGKPLSSSALAKNYLIHNVSSAEVEKTCPMLSNKPTFLKAQHLINPPAIKATQETQVWFLGQKNPLKKENDNPMQYSCLKHPMDRVA